MLDMNHPLAGKDWRFSPCWGEFVLYRSLGGRHASSYAHVFVNNTFDTFASLISYKILTPKFGCCFIQSLDDALLYYSFYVPFYLTLSICIAGMATFRLSIFCLRQDVKLCIVHSCNYCPYYFQWNMHFGEANDANEATPPWIQDLSFDIELVSFREANLKNYHIKRWAKFQC